MAAEYKQSRRKFLIGGIALAALAGCQTGPRTTEPPPTTTVPTPTPTGPVVEADRLRVAVLAPLTGDNGAVGTSIANAAKMALLDLDNDNIRLTIYDTAARGGATKAVNDALAAGNGLILGPLLSANVRQVAPAARQRGVPVLAFSNDEQVAGDGVYIMGFTPTQSIEHSVRYARAQGARDFAALVPSGDYGQRSAQAFLRTVDDVNGEARAIETFDRSREGIDAAIQRIRAREEIDALLIADSGRVAGYIAPKIETGISLMGTELWAAEDNLGQTRSLQGAIYSSVPSARFESLERRYRNRYGGSPFRLSSLGYDGMLLAIRASQSWQPGTPFPVELLRDRGGFEGVDGIFRFDRNGIAQRALEVRRVTAGGHEVVQNAANEF